MARDGDEHIESRGKGPIQIWLDLQGLRKLGARQITLIFPSVGQLPEMLGIPAPKTGWATDAGELNRQRCAPRTRAQYGDGRRRCRRPINRTGQGTAQLTVPCCA